MSGEVSAFRSIDKRVFFFFSFFYFKESFVAFFNLCNFLSFFFTKVRSLRPGLGMTFGGLEGDGGLVEIGWSASRVERWKAEFRVPVVFKRQRPDLTPLSNEKCLFSPCHGAPVLCMLLTVQHCYSNAHEKSFSEDLSRESGYFLSLL